MIKKYNEFLNEGISDKKYTEKFEEIIKILKLEGDVTDVDYDEEHLLFTFNNYSYNISKQNNDDIIVYVLNSDDTLGTFDFEDTDEVVVKILEYDETHDYNMDNDGVENIDNIDLSIELEHLLRTLSDEELENTDVNSFLESLGIKESEMTGFAWGAILKNKRKYEDMSDSEFEEVYNIYKNK